VLTGSPENGEEEKREIISVEFEEQRETRRRRIKAAHKLSDRLSEAGQEAIEVLHGPVVADLSTGEKKEVGELLASLERRLVDRSDDDDSFLPGDPSNGEHDFSGGSRVELGERRWKGISQ